MKNSIEILTLGITLLSFISCQSKKGFSNSESRFYADSIYSENLSENRKHNVYLPKEFDIEKKI